MARRLVILQASIGLLLFRSVDALRPSSFDEDAAQAEHATLHGSDSRRSALAHSVATSLNVSAVEVHSRVDQQSSLGDLGDCKKAIKKFFLDSESDDTHAFFQTPEATGIEVLYKFWLLAMEEKVMIHKSDFKPFYDLFLGLWMTHKFYHQQFEEHVKYTTDLKSLQRFLKGFAESFALLAENHQHSPLMGSYLVPLIEHLMRFNRVYGGFTATVQLTDYYQPPKYPYECNQEELMCSTIKDWATVVDTKDHVRLPLVSGKQIAAKAKEALLAVWPKCFGVVMEGGGHNGITPNHPLFSNDKFKPFDVDYATEDHVANYLGAVFHFALMDNYFEVMPPDDHSLTSFITKAIEMREPLIPAIDRDDLPYIFPASILAAESWFWNDDVQNCLQLVYANFLHNSMDSSVMDLSMAQGIFKSEVVLGINQMVEYFKLDDLPTTIVEKYPGAAAKIANAALALQALNAYWEEMIQAAVTAGDVQWLEHLLKQFADSFAVTADERDMAGGYTVPLVVLHDNEQIIDEFLKADVRVQGSDDTEVKLASIYPHLKVFGGGLSRLQALFAPAAKKALEAVWDACFKAFPFEREFAYLHLYKDPGSVWYELPDYVTMTFEHTGSSWLFTDLLEPPFFAQVRKAIVHYDWIEPQIALEPVPQPGEQVTEDQLTCSRKIRQRLASSSGQRGLPTTAAAQGMVWLQRFLAAMGEQKDIDLLAEKETEFDTLQKATGAVAVLKTWWGKKFDEVTMASPQKSLPYLRTLLYRFLHMFAVNHDQGIAAMYGGFAVPLAAMEREWEIFHELLATKFAQESLNPGCMWARGSPGFDPVQFEQEALDAIRAVWEVCIPFKTYGDKLLGKPLVDEAFAWSRVDARQTLLEQLKKAESGYNWEAPVEELLPLLPRG
mmetsp:Transcript_20041/g.36190  ORF Transcript_20041/g.36190 Transcript_20041/m.36190 type:complete len:895 (+) Transcript_20041:90-2774(+)